MNKMTVISIVKDPFTFQYLKQQQFFNVSDAVLLLLWLLLSLVCVPMLICIIHERTANLTRNLYKIMYQLATTFTTMEINLWFHFDFCIKELWGGLFPLVRLFIDIKCEECKSVWISEQGTLTLWTLWGALESLGRPCRDGTGSACAPETGHLWQTRGCVSVRDWWQQRGSLSTFSLAIARLNSSAWLLD